MANEKISQLLSGGAVQTGDLFVIARGGENYKITGTSVFTSTSITGLLKGDGSALSAAIAGTDYLLPNGDGSLLINLNASNIASGTLNVARLPTTGTGNVVLATGATINTAAFGLRTKDSGGSGNSLVIVSAEALPANRNLSIILNGAHRAFNLSGDLTTAGNHNLIFTLSADTNIALPASGTIASLSNTLNQFATTNISAFGTKISGASNGQLLIGKTDGSLAAANIIGSPSIAIANGDGSITIDLQDNEVPFTDQTSITVDHGLGRKPFIQVLDVSGVVINTGVNIKHNSNDQFEVTSDESISGSIVYI